LLQILDDGRLTDNQGRTVDFKNTIIIMTSNLGSEYLMKNDHDAQFKVEALIRKSFKPEFINRIDEIVIFNSLNRETQVLIVQKMLTDLKTRLQKTGISVDFTEAVGRAVIDNAYDPEYGARPLKRYIQRYLETAIARAIVGDGIDATKPIKIDYRDSFTVTN
jgi:ATP-dependent Clp protease ATP-binding subunit ClpB